MRSLLFRSTFFRTPTLFRNQQWGHIWWKVLDEESGWNSRKNVLDQHCESRSLRCLSRQRQEKYARFIQSGSKCSANQAPREATPQSVDSGCSAHFFQYVMVVFPAFIRVGQTQRCLTVRFVLFVTTSIWRPLCFEQIRRSGKKNLRCSGGAVNQRQGNRLVLRERIR